LIRVKPHEKFRGVYWVYMEDGLRHLATLNLTPGRSVYGERLVKTEQKEYRLWDPYRSKLAAAIHKGIDKLPIEEGVRVLYLGAASGTTSSHVSDIVGRSGRVYCVEFAQRAFRDLLNNVAAHRANIIPILADARIPEAYRVMVGGVNAIYCDVAQPEQAKILADNADMYLKPGGQILLAVKARSIDVAEEPNVIFEREVEVLRGRGFRVEEVTKLEPYDKDHALISATYLKKRSANVR